MLAPVAQDTDQAERVPAENLRALTEARLWGLAGPLSAGGSAVSTTTFRAISEILAGACGVTYFVWAQHHTPVRMLAASANVDLCHRYLRRLCAGATIAGVAFAYLRRPGAPAVIAEPVDGGYRVSGEAPWVTSWDIANLYLVSAVSGAQVVWFCVEAGAAGLRPSPSLALAAMNASATVRLSLCDLFVPHEQVVATEDMDDWRRRDALATAQPHPAPLGIAASACRLMAGTRTAAGAAAILESELVDCRAHSYDLADRAGPVTERMLAAMIEDRAWGIDLALRAATALVVASAGRAMTRADPAQRLLREAAFFAIQAQTRPLAQATLRRLTGSDAQVPPSISAAATPAAAE